MKPVSDGLLHFGYEDIFGGRVPDRTLNCTPTPWSLIVAEEDRPVCSPSIGMGLGRRSQALCLSAVMSSVARRSEDVLKQLIAEAPPGLLLDSPWLAQHGVSRQLAHHYAQRGWLERVAHGLYRLPQPQGYSPGRAADWVIPVLSAQYLGYDLHIGGPTALALQGYAHY